MGVEARDSSSSGSEQSVDVTTWGERVLPAGVQANEVAVHAGAVMIMCNQGAGLVCQHICCQHCHGVASQWNQSLVMALLGCCFA